MNFDSMILWESIILFMSYVEFFRIWLKMIFSYD